MLGPLAGKVAIVTGSSRNIGRAIALGLAADGAKLCVNGLQDHAAADAVVTEIKSAGGDAFSVIADAAKPDGVARIVDATITKYGGVDIVVANAALRRQSKFEDTSFEEWREVMALILDGAFLLARGTVPSMIARGGGAFIGISGISPHIGFADRVHVNAAKAGLEGLIRGLAGDLGSKGITANAVAPGVIATERTLAMHARNAPPIRVPVARMGEIDEVSDAVRFLAGPGGRYINGQTLHVNGGAFFGR